MSALRPEGTHAPGGSPDPTFDNVDEISDVRQLVDPGGPKLDPETSLDRPDQVDVRPEVRRLFPDVQTRVETAFGLAKSITAHTLPG